MKNEQNKRYLNIGIRATSGKIGKSMRYSFDIPAPWAREMGFDFDNKRMLAEFDGERIILTKAEEEKESDS